MFENPRRGRQAKNFTTNVPKILDLKSSSEQIFQKLSLGAPDTCKKNVQLSNKRVLFSTFEDSFSLQMSSSSQGRLHLLLSLQKNNSFMLVYLYTCKIIAKRTNLDDFLPKLFEQNHNENSGKQY